MSTHDSGFGAKAGRSPEFESDFASAANAPGTESWSASAANTQKSEVPFMVQGAGRPTIGQRSIFGNGGPSFTQMPTYTPVTRGPAQAAPEPQAAPQTAYPPQSPQAAAPAHPRPQAAPRPAAAPRPQAPATPAYQAPQQPPQDFGAHQVYQPQNYGTPANGAPGNAYGDQSLPDLSNADPGFPESIFGDFKSADASFPEPDFSGQGADQNFADAGFPEQGDASFPEASFAPGGEYGADGAFGGGDAMGGDAMGYATAPAGEPSYEALPQTPSLAQMRQPQSYQPQSYQPQSYQPRSYQPQAAQPQHGDVPQSDPRRQLQAFDAVYDQPPQIALGGTQTPAPAPQEFFEADRGDADFLDENQLIPPAGARSKLIKSFQGRSAFMVGSALLGAIALGGALAFAYKQSTGSGSGETPIVTADARPVKEAPAQPGGKEFPHKNKLIYDRLTNGNEPESEQLVPRQEDVAVPALPPATATAGLPAPVATTDFANPLTTQAVEGAEDGEGGPRKVKTLVVRPDGSVEAPPAAAAEMAEAATPDASAEAAAPAGVMPVPAPEAPVAQAAAAPQQMAAADPAPAPAATSKYLVQVGAHKSQTEALAIYADIQQKNPSLLGNYPPVVQKAALNSGTMYRLRVGPIDSKSAADKLCSQLKAQGTDCFVVAQ